MSQPLPPDTRAVGTGNPAGDMDEVVDALTGMGEHRYLSPSGDATGTTDTAVINAVVAALGAQGGNIYLSPGVFYWKCALITIAQAGVYIQGAGRWSTVINAVGTGDVIRMYNATQYNAGNVAGGGISGLTIDGAGAGAGSCAAHIGDIFDLEVDFGVRNFNAAGSVGVHLDNNYSWTEQLTGKIWAEKCATHVLFDNSVNTSGSSTGSFDRAMLDIFINQVGNGNGVVMNNGALIVDGRLGIYGNFIGNATQYTVLTITGSNVANGYSQINRSVLNIGVELNTATALSPQTISIGSQQNNGIYNCTGIIDFSGQFTFANAVNWPGSFQFDGPVLGDTKLLRDLGVAQNPYQVPSLANGAIIPNRFASLLRVVTTVSVTGIILQGFGPDSGHQVTIINAGTGSITFDVAGTSNVAAGIAEVIPPGTAACYVWSQDTSLWYRIGTPDTSGLDTVSSLSGVVPSYDCCPRQSLSGSASVLTSGTILVNRVLVPGGKLLSKLGFCSGGTAAVTPAHWWMLLCTQAGVILGVTADQLTAAIGTFAVKDLAMTAPVNAPGSPGDLQFLYVALMVAAATPPSLESSLAIGVGNSAPAIVAYSSTGQTGPPAAGGSIGALTLPTLQQISAMWTH